MCVVGSGGRAPGPRGMERTGDGGTEIRERRPGKIRSPSPVPRGPGGDLLSRALRRSTIGAEGFHGRVRDGIGCGPLAVTTRSTRHGGPRSEVGKNPLSVLRPPNGATRAFACARLASSDQADRAIRTGQLHALLRFHTRPIDVVVFHGSQGRTRFEGGFPLRCLQRLSRPDLATRLCRWRDNRSTRGPSTPVLSY